MQLQRIGRSGYDVVDENWTFQLQVLHENEEIWSTAMALKASGRLEFATIPIPVSVEPGKYDIVCRAESASGEVRVLRQGFWGRDDVLLRTGSPLTCDRDYFRRDGKPMPIVGMTYMTSDVARKYIQLPNVSVWDRDMRQMKDAGINLIRTGIWTGWRQVMFVDGHASEEALRAIDAFILSAKRYELEVTFNFFAFTPEAWEGVNPYLDPRSRAAQKRFVSAIVSRHRDTTNVHWDLINEPSMFDPKRIFSGPRSVGDPYEKSAWVQWLRNRHGRIEDLQDRWNMTPDELPTFDAANLPEQQEINFDVEDMGTLKKGTRWLDYTLFTMDMHNAWARDLAETIRTISPNRLVTVGQDEALGIGPRPSPFFYAQAVDYTTVHSWWLNDALVWDGVFSKALDKPNLIQETGIMYLETPDNRAKRTEHELRNILERKYAYAFATGGAGAVQWIWNTNIYMDNINESNIGALRADGTEKPEAEVSYDFGRFMGRIGHLFENRQLEDVAVVFPYSNDFSNRRLAFDATTQAIRVLSYGMKVPVRGLSEYHLDALVKASPKLLMVPSAHNISEGAVESILRYVESGGTLLWTGPIGYDAYWRPISRLSHLFGAVQQRNILREETLEIQGQTYPVSFSHRRIAEVTKEVPTGAGNGNGVLRETIGDGTMIWCPLPVELNDRQEVMMSLYGYALTEARVHSPIQWLHGNLPGVYGRKMTFAQGSLFVFVSEQVTDVEVEIEDEESGKRYRFVLEEERSVLFATEGSGHVIDSYRDVPISTN